MRTRCSYFPPVLLAALFGMVFVASPLYAQPPPGSSVTPQSLDTLKKKGIDLYLNGDYDGAERQFRDGYAQATTVDDKARAGDFMARVGYVQHTRLQYPEAEASYRQGLALQTQAKDYKGMGDTRMNLGTLLQELNRYEDAANNDREGIACYRQLPATPAIALQIARMQNNIGSVYTDLERYTEALQYLTSALETFAAHQRPSDQAQVRHNMSNIYLYTGQYETALNLQMENLHWLETQPPSSRLGLCLSSIGMLYRARQDNDKADEYCARAEPLLKDADPKWRGVCDMTRGNIAIDRKQWEQARVFLERARQTFTESQDACRQAIAELNLGAVYARNKETLEQAYKANEQALKTFRAIGSQRMIGTALYNMATQREEQGRNEEADALYKSAIQTLESARDQVSDAAQMLAMESVTTGDTYARYARLLVRQKQNWQALAILEQGRALVLARKAMETQIASSLLLPAPQARQWEQAEQKLQRAGQRIVGAEHSAQSSGSPQAKAALQSARRMETEAELELLLLRKQLMDQNPQWRPLTQLPPPSRDTLRALAREHSDTLFLTWSVVDDYNTLLLALPPGGEPEAYELPVGRDAWAKMVKRWLSKITMGIPSQSEEAAQCYQQMLAPIEKAGWLRDKRVKRLVLVPDGPLLQAPLAALRDGNGHCLIERFPLSGSPALGLLTWPANPRKPTGTLLCVADPLRSSAVGKRAGAENGKGALPRARAEGVALAGLFHHSLLLTGPQARRTAVLGPLRLYAVVHFATHGLFDAANGFRSRLMLAAPEGGEPETLQAREIADLPMSASLAVLSACESAQGQEVGGEGLVGLCWAFRAAGCVSVVASQWKVDDEATRLLMLRFYAAMQAGLPKDKALQTAILEVKSKAAYDRPFYWAAFQLFGDPSPLPAALWSKPTDAATPKPVLNRLKTSAK